MQGTGLIFITKIAVLDRQNAVFAALACILPAALAAALSGYIRAENKPIFILLFFESILAGSMFLRIYSELITVVLLPEYSKILIAAAMLAAVLYGCSKGKKAGRRLAVIAVPLILLCTAVCLIPAAKDMDIKNIDIVPKQPLNAVKNSLYAGLLLALPLISLYGEKNKRGLNIMPLFAAVWISSAAAVIIWLSRFNYAAERPVLDLMYAGDGASSFIRRQEGLILGIITVSAYFLLNNMLGCAALALGGGSVKNGGCAICAAIMLVCAFLPETAETAEWLFEYSVLLGGTVLLIILPAVNFMFKERKIL